MPPRARPLTIITGASRGIGAALARALAAPATELILVGRNRGRLEAVARAVEAAGATASWDVVDLLDRDGLVTWAAALAGSRDRVDLLVHSAGLFTRGPLSEASAAEIADQMEIHAGAPLILTRALLPALTASRGTVLFINSTAVQRPGAELTAYTAAKTAQRALADSLRAEVAGEGVRVMSAFVGRTATPMQAQVHALEGRDYHPERFMQPADLAECLVRLLGAPADVAEVTIRSPGPVVQRPTDPN